MSSQSPTHRRRGVQASRVKLTRALNDAGIPTQAALAERIADLEDSDAPPRDMVNRAFRELHVEHRSLDRIAHALGVEPYALYKTSDEAAREPGLPEPPDAPEQTSTQPWRRWVLLVALVLVAALLTITVTRPPNNDILPGDSPRLTMGRPAVMVMDLRGDSDLHIADRIRNSLQARFNVASRVASATNTRDLAALADRLRLDAVVSGELVSRGRLTGLRLFAFSGGVRQQIWAESLPANALPSRADQLAATAAAAVSRLFDRGDDEIPHFPLAPVQDEYLWGEFYLDEPANELNLKRAESRFQAALRQDPNYAKAHAGLCQALMLEHWMLEEDRMLEDARVACSQALLHDPEDIVVRTAHAHFLHRTGRPEEAAALYEELAQAYPDYPSVYEGAAALHLARFRETGDHRYLEAAKAEAYRAAEIAPSIWKPLFSLATMQYYDGDVQGAIEASEAGLQRQENEYLLANLGTFQVCAGDFNAALATTLRAREIAPHSYVGDEFLGMVYYFLGDFERAVKLRESAVASIGEGEPEIHEMWGQLGDAYRHNGQREAAIEAYRKALDIVERDHLRGTEPATNSAARAYYTLTLDRLSADARQEAALTVILEDLDKVDAEQIEPSGHRWMAQSWLMVGEREKAVAALRRATARCPGYGRIPDLRQLAEEVLAGVPADTARQP